MSHLVFYDVTPQEKIQFTTAFADQHQLAFVSDKISEANLEVNCEVLSVFVDSMVTAEMINRLPKLKLIACRSTGYNNIAIDSARAKNVSVVNVPTYGSHTVAEYTIGLMLSLTRKLPHAMTAADTGQSSREKLEGTDLHGKTLGILGAGRIGTNVAALGAAFGMRVLAYDPIQRSEFAKQYNFTYAPLESVLQQADIISLHVPYTPQNHHLLNDTRLKLVRHGAMIINTARGELIDTRALINALQNGHISGIALDVLEGELLMNAQEESLLLRSDTIPPEMLRHSLEISYLQKLPNVIVTNHNAFNTREAMTRITTTTIDNIINFLQGKTANTV